MLWCRRGRCGSTSVGRRQEWAEAQAKLARITADGYDTEITKLGGKAILDQLVAAHQAYGEALGITVEGQDPNIKLREPLLAFNKYLRAYVVAVTAHTDPDDPASGALADALLAPLHKWQTYINVAAAEPAPPAATQPGIPAGSAQAPAAPSPAVPTPTNGPGVEPVQH